MILSVPKSSPTTLVPLPPFVQMARDHTNQASPPSHCSLSDPTLIASSPFFFFAASQKNTNKKTNKPMY